MFYNDVLYLHLSFTGIIHLNIIYLLFLLFQLRHCQSGPECPSGEFPAHILGLLLKKIYLHIFLNAQNNVYVC